MYCKVSDDYKSMLYNNILPRNQCDYNNVIPWPHANPYINYQFKKHSMLLSSKCQFQPCNLTLHFTRSPSIITNSNLCICSQHCSLVLPYGIWNELLQCYFYSILFIFLNKSSCIAEELKVQHIVHPYVHLSSRLLVCSVQWNLMSGL